MSEEQPSAGQDLAYRARALAQAHPLSPVAKRYIDAAMAEERASQAMPEISTWASVALLHGYCVRRVEEADARVEVGADDADISLEVLEAETAAAAADLRAGEAQRFLLDEEERTIEALDRIVASEIDKRLDNLRDDVDEDAWTELEEYLTWWVVKGYALRVAEMAARRAT